MACSALRAFWRGRKRRSFPERRGSTAMPSGGYSFWKWEQEKEWRKESPPSIVTLALTTSVLPSA